MHFKQSLTVFALLFGVVFAFSIKNRHKRAAYELPDGIEFYIGDIKTTFQCPGTGFYADTDNNCQLFHICVQHEYPDGKTELAQFSFACGNQTVFNQFSMTCAYPEDAIPCNSSPDFYYLNELLGYAEQPLHRPEDVERAAGYFGARA